MRLLYLLWPQIIRYVTFVIKLKNKGISVGGTNKIILQNRLIFWSFKRNPTKCLSTLKQFVADQVGDDNQSVVIIFITPNFIW